MSPARAPRRSSPPKVRVYAFCTHDRPVDEKWRLRRMSGSAVMTTVASRMIIRYVVRMMARITVRFPVRSGSEGRVGARRSRVVVMGWFSRSWRVRVGLKWRCPPQLSGGCLRILYGGNLRFAS
jgi:hypothetical protein